MNKQIAYFISYIFQPLLMATFLYATVLWIIPLEAGLQFSSENKLRLLLIVFLITAVLPMLSIFVMKLTSGISSIHLVKRKDRITPFFFIAAYYVFAAYLLVAKISLGLLFDTLIITIAGLVLIMAINTLFWKISVHSIGVAGTLGFIMGMNYNSPDSLFYWPIFGWILIVGFTMSARLYLNAHLPMEVWLGALLGFVVCFSSVVLFV